MKRLQLLIGLAVLLGVNIAHAVPFKLQTFLDPRAQSIQVSNNIGGWTNYLSIGATTNWANLLWTNSDGTLIKSGTNAPLDSCNLLAGDPQLWVNQCGDPVINTNGFTFASVCIKLTGVAAAANSAVNFRFVALPDGVNEETSAGGSWVVGVTANGTTGVYVRTNFPANQFIGCKAIRLKSIENSDTDANSAVWVQQVSFTGFPP